VVSSVKEQRRRRREIGQCSWYHYIVIVHNYVVSQVCRILFAGISIEFNA
jgi:hypothetical protein